MLADKGNTGGGLTDNNWSSLIGIVTAIVGNVLISIALNLQRYAHIRLRQKWDETQDSSKSSSKHSRGTDTSKDTSNGSKGRKDSKDGRNPDETQPLLGNRGDSGDEEESHPQGSVDNIPEKSYLRSPLWWAGQILMTVGEAGNFLAYGFAPASIVSPLGVVALISNCIIAPFFLKERFRKRDALGVIIAVGGAVTVALSASDNNPKLGPDELWGLIKRWEFLTYLGITCGAIIVLMVISNRYGHKSIFIDLGLVGLFGGYTALSTKGVASLLSYTIFKALTFGITYLLAGVLIFTAVMQIKYLNRALRRFNATQVIPTQFVFFTLSVILGSAVLYRDFERTPGDQAGKFIGGCAMTFLGVWLITSARKQDEEESEEEDEYDGDDETIRMSQNGEQRTGSVSSHGDKRNASVSSKASSRFRNGSAIPQITLRQPTMPTSPQMSRRSTSQAAARGRPSIDPLADAALTASKKDDLNPRSKSAIRDLFGPITRLWSQERTHPPALPYTMQESTSAPVLPSEARIGNRPVTPALQVTSIEEPITPVSQQLTTEESARLHRPSFADLIPGPLAGSWSSPLSGIVADSLRRGINTTPRPRRGDRLQSDGVSWYASLRRRSEAGAERMNFSDVQQDLVAGERPSRPGTPQGTSPRSRSMSTTFGGLLRWPSNTQVPTQRSEAGRARASSQAQAQAPDQRDDV